MLYKNQNLTITYSRYLHDHDQIHIQLWAEDGPFATATVGIDDDQIEWNDEYTKLAYHQNMWDPRNPPFIATIKNYTENEGIETALQHEKIIDEPVGRVKTGYVYCNVYLVQLASLRWDSKYMEDQEAQMADRLLHETGTLPNFNRR